MFQLIQDMKFLLPTQALVKYSTSLQLLSIVKVKETTLSQQYSMTTINLFSIAILTTLRFTISLLEEETILQDVDMTLHTPLFTHTPITDTMMSERTSAGPSTLTVESGIQPWM